MKKQQGTLVIEVQYDKNGTPHMDLNSPFDLEQNIQILNTLTKLLHHSAPFRAYDYVSTPYLN